MLFLLAPADASAQATAQPGNELMATPSGGPGFIGLRTITNADISSARGTILSLPSLVTVGTLTTGGTGAGFTLALSLSTLTGNLPCLNMPALTGNIVSSTGSCATTLAAGIVNNSNLANMAGQTIKANLIGSSAAPTDATPAQVGALLCPMRVQYLTSGSGATFTTDTCNSALPVRIELVALGGWWSKRRRYERYRHGWKYNLMEFFPFGWWGRGRASIPNCYCCWRNSDGM